MFAERIVRHFGLVVTSPASMVAELDGRLDDKADLLRHLLATERLAAGGTVMIGDRRGDVLAAPANGLRAIGVLWGYGSERELLGAGADVICADPRALIARLAG